MFHNIKLIFILLCVVLFNSFVMAEDEEIYLKAISDQIQVITKDIKTLEKAVYQKADITNSTKLNINESDGLNEDVMTKHLLKLNEIENQFRQLTNKFEEVNFKLDKLSTRVTKIQSDAQLRFSDLENGISTTSKKTNSVLPGSTKPQDGETFRIRQLYSDAATAYLDGYQNYPKSDKAPDNLLKLGITMVQLGEKDQGCKMISGLKKEYPKASKSVLQKAQYEQKKFKCKS